MLQTSISESQTPVILAPRYRNDRNCHLVDNDNDDGFSAEQKTEASRKKRIPNSDIIELFCYENINPLVEVWPRAPQWPEKKPSLGCSLSLIDTKRVPSWLNSVIFQSILSHFMIPIVMTL